MGIENLLQGFGIRFQNAELLQKALTHKSFGVKPETHNEKLEFLGDAVLDLALADLLMKRFPDNDEGRLSKKRASLVNEKSLAAVASSLKLGDHLRLGKSELQSQGALKPRLLASTLEALMGAVYLDQGFEKTRELVFRLFDALLANDDVTEDFRSDYKTRFQEAVQARDKVTPVYKLTSEDGPPHARRFTVRVETDGRVWAEAEGSSKKAAEQEAARAALAVLESEAHPVPEEEKESRKS
ncbi:MAG: ribonuclease III [Bdellovibrionaceae bacterium]|nr:ribonuclease III [Pseudobdellovibrionaceae bacterium]